MHPPLYVSYARCSTYQTLRTVLSTVFMNHLPSFLRTEHGVKTNDFSLTFGSPQGPPIFVSWGSPGFPDRPRLDLINPSTNRMTKRASILDTVAGRTVFYLPWRCMEPGTARRLDGHYLLVWSLSGEVMVIDLICVLDRES